MVKGAIKDATAFDSSLPCAQYIIENRLMCNEWNTTSCPNPLDQAISLINILITVVKSVMSPFLF